MGILFISLLICAGCTQVQAPAPVQSMAPTAATVMEPASPATTTATAQAATKEAMLAFIKEAVAYAKHNGKEKALAEFSNANGSFFRSLLYI